VVPKSTNDFLQVYVGFIESNKGTNVGHG